MRLIALEYLNVSRVRRCNAIHTGNHECTQNRLHSLDNCGLPNMSNLCYLDVSSNQLTSLPINLGDLQALQHLLARKNQLVRLSASIQQYEMLLQVELPSSIGSIVSLLVIDVTDNCLSSIPATVSPVRLGTFVLSS
jgi:Leucine-rich repeat (LRR) protein